MATRILYAGLIAAWLLACDTVLRAALGESAQAPALVGALVFVGLSGLMIVVLMVREVTARRETQQLLESISLLTDPALARLAPDELFRELLARTTRVLTADVASLFVLDDARNLVLRASTGAGRSHGDLPDRVIAEGQPVLVNELEGPLRSFLGCPLLVEGEVCGLLAVAAADRNSFTADDVRLVRRVADRFAWAVERSQFDEVERAAEEAVAEGEHRVRTLVEAAPLGIVELGPDGEVTRWNRAAAALLGWPRWLEGKEAPETLPAEAKQAATTAADGHRIDGVAATVERENTRDVQLAVSAAPLTDREGNIEGVLLVLDDVTERQQLEQHVRQAQRLEAMARLAGSVAHDFNNLLTVIQGHTEFLLHTMDKKDERREDVDAIRVAGQRAAELTKQLLTIGRRQVVEPEVLDLHARVRELEPVLRRLVGDDVELRVVTGSESGPVRVDPGELDQVLMNLVINARDAMPEGGRIIVETRSLELRPRGASLAGVTAGRYVLLTVADTGVGMSSDVLEHCFDPFFTTKGRGKGTGLGLAAVYATATQAGGHATVESEVGRGTTFRLWFPDLVAGEVAPVSPTPTRRRTRRRTAAANGLVLLVEDEAPIRSLARATLEQAGHAVMEAGSAEEALTKGEGADEQFDVLVSDIALGGMPGDELALKLRAKWPDLGVVLMSGFTDHSAVLEPDAFLAKPFPLDELVRVVGELITARSGTPRRGRSSPTAGATGRPRSSGARGARAR